MKYYALPILIILTLLFSIDTLGNTKKFSKNNSLIKDSNLLLITSVSNKIYEHFINPFKTENKIINNVKLLEAFSITEFPVENQIYKRDKATSTSAVKVSGSCTSSSEFSSILLEVYRNDVLFFSQTQNLDYVGDNADFNFTATINAELADYTFKLVSNTDIVLKEASNVASGDIYIVTGQSNALRHSYSPNSFPFSNNYIRTVSNSNVFTTNLNINSDYAIGGIGYWTANNIITTNKIPILVFAQSDGGKPIEFFQANPTNKFDSTTNYGQLLSRTNNAKYEAGDITAILWYQGESDALPSLNTSGSEYKTLFKSLYDSWMEDYNPNQIYVVQIRHNDRGTPDESQIPNAQRTLSDDYNNVSIVSTNGIAPGPDNRHYSNDGSILNLGYRYIAERIYGLLNYQVYNSTINSGIYSPNIANEIVNFADCNRNKIEFYLRETNDTYVWETGTENDFKLLNYSGTITGGNIAGNKVTLNLSEAIPFDSTVTLNYLAPSPSITPIIKNQNNIGLLSFQDVVVEGITDPIPTFTQISPICKEEVLSALPTTSLNGVQGSWSPTLNNTQTTAYTFTPTPINDACIPTASMTIEVNTSSTIPTFLQIAPVCAGDFIPLPTTSLNNIKGVWSPEIDYTQTTTYTFTPNQENCGSTVTMIVTVISGEVCEKSDFFIASTGLVTIVPGSFLYFKANTTIADGGLLNVNSDASKSASLLVVPNATVTGNITYNRFVDDDWNIIGAPVATQSIQNFGTNSANNIAQNTEVSPIKYAIGSYNVDNVAGSRWEYYNTDNISTAGNFINGNGYSTLRTVAGNYKFTGEYTDTDVSVSLVANTNLDHNWNFIANPYPYFLKLTDVSSNSSLLKANLSNINSEHAALYLWDGTDYVPVNYLDGLTYLAPGQGFLVNRTIDESNFIFSEYLQTHHSLNDNFQKTENTVPEIMLQLTNGNARKQTKLKFLSNTTRGLDIGYDAGYLGIEKAPFLLNTHLAENSQGVNFTLQCLPDNNYELNKIPLSIIAKVNETIVFSAFNSNLPANIDVYIEDIILNTYTKINDIESYEVTLTNDLSGIGRFYLRTSSGVLSTETNLVGSPIHLYKTSNGTVKITGLTSGSAATFSLFTILGKEVFATKFIAQNVKEISLPASLSSGVYIVGVVSNSGTFHKKIIIE